MIWKVKGEAVLELQGGYSFTGVPYMTYEALDEYAEGIIRDAMPENLNRATPLDVDEFLEFYLKVLVEYKKLSLDGKVLGLTAFDDGLVRVIDESKNDWIALRVRAGTVIVDNSLLEPKQEARLRFTLMHEASHWLLHARAFSVKSEAFAAKEGRADYSPSKKEKSDRDRMERQADFLAAALLIPRPSLCIACAEYWATYGQAPMIIERGKDDWHNCHAKMLPAFVADRFCVSKQAAKIRLEKLNMLVGKETVRTRLW